MKQVVKMLMISVDAGTDLDVLREGLVDAFSNLGCVTDWALTALESEPVESDPNSPGIFLDNKFSFEIPESSVFDFWEGETEMVAVNPDFYQDNGTLVDPETGDDMRYIKTTIVL